MTRVLDARHLTKVYSTAAGDTVALEDVSLHVDGGEFVAIMGPSGSGKSTLMNMLGLLDRQTTGELYLDGINVATLDEVELAQVRATRIGFVFQAFNLLPRISVIQNVMMPMAYLRIPRRERVEKARRVLEAVDLDPTLYDHKSNELSGGQMQRVAIARALSCDPSLILADEPTGNLDSKTGEMILAKFEQLRDEGRTIVLITHDPEVAERADRTVHIRDGHIYDGVYRGEERADEKVGPSIDPVGELSELPGVGDSVGNGCDVA